MAVIIDDADGDYGHAVKGARVRKVGHYGRGRGKVTVIMFVEPGDPALPADELGSIERPRIWYDVNTERGTTSAKYEWFVKTKLLNRLKRDEPSRVFMHDNFVSHKTDEVYELFYRAGHTVVCRAPYRPDEAPIELVFDMLKNEIRRRWSKIDNEVDLIMQIHDIIKTRAGMKGFDKLFVNCGYTWETDAVVTESKLEEDKSAATMDDEDEDNEPFNVFDMLSAEIEEDDDLLIDSGPDFGATTVEAPRDGYKFDSSFTRLIKMPENVDSLKVDEKEVEEEEQQEGEEGLKVDEKEVEEEEWVVEEVSRSSGRCKYTIQLLEKLQKAIRAEGETVTINHKSATNTHTASISFFELLRLKSLDYIELEQTEPGSIKVSAGPKFREKFDAG